MADVIWSGNSKSAGSNSGPGTGISYSGYSSGSSSPSVISSGLQGAVNVGYFPASFAAPAYSAFDNRLNNNNLAGHSAGFKSIDDVFNTISSLVQNTFGGGSQNNNNENYMRLMRMQNEYNTNSAERAMEFNKQSAKRAMDFSRDMAERQMKFQQYNADTSYQRMVKDLKAAGLNPILAAFNGGAPSPVGSSAQGIAATGFQSHSAQPGYDEGYNGVSQIIGQLISNLPMLSIASAINGLLPKVKDNLTNVTDDIGKVVKSVTKTVDKFLSPSQKAARGYGGSSSPNSNFIGPMPSRGGTR